MIKKEERQRTREIKETYRDGRGFVNHDQVVVAMDDAHGFTQDGPLVSIAVGAERRTRQKNTFFVFSMFDSFKIEDVTSFI